MSKYSCVQFDMDGTLIDSIPVIIESFQRAVSEVYGKREINPKILKNSIGLPLQESFAHYPIKDQPNLHKAYIAANDELQENGIPLFEGVYEMLEILKDKGLRLAVVTSKRIEPTIKLLTKLNLEDFFEVIVGKEMTIRHKPDSEPILKCMKLMEMTDKRQVLYVGDSLHDLCCAQNAGVDIAIVDWTKMAKEELKRYNPSFWLRKPMDLYDIVT